MINSKGRKSFETWKVVHFDVYGFAVEVVYTEDIIRSVESRGLPRDERDSTTTGLAFHSGDEPYSYIFLPKNACQGTIAHECWHVIRHMMEDWLGMELENEVVAYNLGYLVEKAQPTQRE